MVSRTGDQSPAERRRQSLLTFKPAALVNRLPQPGLLPSSEGRAQQLRHGRKLPAKTSEHTIFDAFLNVMT